MQRQVQDHFFKRAKALGYVARSAFKLEEIQKKHRVIPPGGLSFAAHLLEGILPWRPEQHCSDRAPFGVICSRESRP